MPGLVRQAISMMDANHDGRVKKGKKFFLINSFKIKFKYFKIFLDEFVGSVMKNPSLMDILDPFK